MSGPATERGKSGVVGEFVAWFQGAYFFLFGLWPLVGIHSFQAVTGEKTDHLVAGREGDHWLVNTVGALIAVVGFVLLVAAWRRRVRAEVALLGMASAGALPAVDVIYVWRETNAPIYLADAALKPAFVAAWLVHAAIAAAPAGRGGRS
jgi:hypothetical protein